MLIKSLKKNWLAVVASAYSLIVALFWLALRVNWSGISKALGADKNPTFFVMETPLIICIFLWLAFAFAFFSMLFWKRKLPSVISLSVSGVFTVIIIVVIALGACDYMSFIMPKFLRSLLVSLALVVFALLLFFPPVHNGKTITILKWICLGCMVLLCLTSCYNITLTNSFTYGAVVYAVEDDYQIVFSTSANSIAWVDVDGTKYYDLYAGSMKSKDLVHKVVVPQEALDSAKGYTICAQKMIYRGPFGGYKGKIISQDYNFRPVDTSDGLTYYSMTDVHGARKGAVNAAKSVSNMDFLVMLGDNISMVDSEYDAQFANLLANDITGGEFPCIYVRGNHEVKGNYAEDLHKYVGSQNGNFYYWFTLSDKVFGITLDLGEDHDDDWWEYYETAQFDLYRDEQTAMLDKIIAKQIDKDYETFQYRLTCCHIPLQYINSRGNHAETKPLWTSKLNIIQPDLVVSGHQHELVPFLEGQACMKKNLTDFQFNGFIVGRRGAAQSDKVGSVNSRDHIGLVTVVDFVAKNQTSYYVNAKHEKVTLISTTLPNGSQTEFVTQLKTGN